MTASYSGDANNTGSVSATLVERINSGFASKTVVVTSGSPSFVGQPVTFTATVTSRFGAIPDGELVTFYEDRSTTLASVPLVGGTAAYTTSSLSAALCASCSARRHGIKATYAGDATFAPDTAWVQQVVDRYATTTALSSSPNPSTHGQAVTFTATVTPTGPYPLTGEVVFRDGTTWMGAATVSGGVATHSEFNLAVGTHAITAQYVRDADNAASTSPVLGQVVQ
jgi:hypothetical protein